MAYGQFTEGTRAKLFFRQMYKDKVLMITGGTGSFGNAILNHFLDSDLREIRIYSRDEKKQEDMRIRFRNDKMNFIVGDVRDFDHVKNTMAGVDYVFHAAALKQVPSCEFYPMEAIKTNILGAENVLEAARINGVSRMVVLSTDKAVYPINTMGMSKALMEKLTVSKSREPAVLRNKSVYCATRYGNVMCSRGSIIPLLISQIRSGQPLTVTDPRMTRFMMTLKDSVRLVLFAFEHAEPGDIFVQKAPASTIMDLAIALKELFDASNDIHFIGARHGEKMYETLCSREELSKAQDLGDFYRIPADLRDLNYTRFVQTEGPPLSEKEYTSDNTRRLSIAELKELLLTTEFVKEQLAAL